MIETRQQLHSLVDQLPPAQLPMVQDMLAALLDPLTRSILTAPVEEEEITPELAAELDQARASFDNGEGIPHEQILRDFGISHR